MITRVDWSAGFSLVLVALVLAGLGVSNAARGAELDRLLPSDQNAKVSIIAKQDGRAVDIVLSNGSRLVLTGGVVKCYEKSPSPPAPRLGCPAFSRSDITVEALLAAPAESGARGRPERVATDRQAKDPYCTHYVDIPTAVVKKPIESNVLPGKEGHLYVEVSTSAAVDKCIGVDLRGRERRLLIDIESLS